MLAESKLVAVMDRGTRKPMLTFRLHPEAFEERVMLKTHGFGSEPQEYVFFYDINNGRASYDPYKMGDDFTMAPACSYVRNHWDEVESGALVDAEHIRGETDAPRRWEVEYL